MTALDSNEINRLVGEFMDLQEAWSDNPEGFDWAQLDTIVQHGARAYNEGNGPSFQSLALDGVRHSVFHERFLKALLDAGFDPFKLGGTSPDTPPIPVIDHALLAESAEDNLSSARMRQLLMERARSTYGPLLEHVAAGGDPNAHTLFASFKACIESIPDELVQRVAPELARGEHVADSTDGMKEGYLTAAEVQTEEGQRPVG